MKNSKTLLAIAAGIVLNPMIITQSYAVDIGSLNSSVEFYIYNNTPFTAKLVGSSNDGNSVSTGFFCSDDLYLANANPASEISPYDADSFCYGVAFTDGGFTLIYDVYDTDGYYTAQCVLVINYKYWKSSVDISEIKCNSWGSTPVNFVYADYYSNVNTMSFNFVTN